MFYAEWGIVKRLLCCLAGYALLCLLLSLWQQRKAP